MKRAGERGEDKWQRVSWDEALDTIASKFKEIGEKYGYESIALATGTGGNAALVPYMPLKLACALQATWVNVIGFGDAAGPCGDQISYGPGGGDRYTTNFEAPRLCVLWGSNPIETQPFQ